MIEKQQKMSYFTWKNSTCSELTFSRYSKRTFWESPSLIYQRKEKQTFMSDIIALTDT